MSPAALTAVAGGSDRLLCAVDARSVLRALGDSAGFEGRCGRPHLQIITLDEGPQRAPVPWPPRLRDGSVLTVCEDCAVGS